MRRTRATKEQVLQPLDSLTEHLKASRRPCRDDYEKIYINNLRKEY